MSNIKCQISNKKSVQRKAVSVKGRNFRLTLTAFRSSQVGFTLVEMVLYIGIFSLLITLTTSLFLSILDGQENADAISTADQNGEYILSRFMYDIPRAQSISIPSTEGAQNNSLQISINNINYTYSLDTNGNIQRKDITDNLADNLNGYDVSVSGLTFQRIASNDGKDSIRLSFTVTSKTTQERGAQTRNFQTTVGLR